MTAPGRIVVVGSANVDLSVTVDRLPRPGETVLGGELIRGTGGKGANQAIAARRSGAQVCFVGAVGRDDLGEELVQVLGSEGIDVSLVARTEAATGTALIVVDAHGQNMITVSPGANATVGMPAVTRLADVLPGAAALLLQLEIPVRTALAAAQAAHAVGVPVVLNAAPLPAPDDPDLDALLCIVDLLVVNETEAAGLTGLVDAEPSAAAALLLASVSGDIAITLGERGAFAAATAMMTTVPAFPVDAVDAVGAGDAFCGELVVARYHRGLGFAAAVRRACAAGALSTSRRGVRHALPTQAEVDALLAARTGSEEA